MNREKKDKAARSEKPSKTSAMDAPFAVASNGAVLLNVQNFDGVETPEDLLRRALRERSPIFVGVPMTAPEVSFVLTFLEEIMHEPSGYVLGARQQRTRRRR